MRSFSESGQTTVEAAILLPVLFVILGLLVQPVFLLYTQSVMNAAATEACRLAATSTNSEASLRAYIERRLAAVPSLECFHADDSWELEWVGANTGEAEVTITNHVKPLPLLGVVAGLACTMDEAGTIRQTAKARTTCLPSWLCQEDYDPAQWIGAWK